jgi:hypothetical protein
MLDDLIRELNKKKKKKKKKTHRTPDTDDEGINLLSR